MTLQDINSMGHEDLKIKTSEIYHELLKTQKKSSIRKRHLRDLNKKIELYVALADAAISDAARWKLEYQKVKEELDGLKSNQD